MMLERQLVNLTISIGRWSVASRTSEVPGSSPSLIPVEFRINTLALKPNVSMMTSVEEVGVKDCISVFKVKEYGEEGFPVAIA